MHNTANHIIFCAVNFVDYHKYNSNKRSYYGIRNMSDKLCRENGLSVVVPGKGSKGKSYAEYQAEKVGTSWKGKLKIAVDTLILQVASFGRVPALHFLHNAPRFGFNQPSTQGGGMFLEVARCQFIPFLLFFP